MTGNKLYEIISLYTANGTIPNPISKKDMENVPKLTDTDGDVLIEYEACSNEVISKLIKLFYYWNSIIDNNLKKNSIEQDEFIKQKEEFQNILINSIYDNNLTADDDFNDKILLVIELINNRLNHYSEYKERLFESNDISSMINGSEKQAEFIKIAYVTNNKDLISKVDSLYNKVKSSDFAREYFYDYMVNVLKFNPELLKEILNYNNTEQIMYKLDYIGGIINSTNIDLDAFEVLTHRTDVTERSKQALSKILVKLLLSETNEENQKPNTDFIFNLVDEIIKYILKYAYKEEELNEFIEFINIVIDSKDWQAASILKELRSNNNSNVVKMSIPSWNNLKWKLQPILDFEYQFQLSRYDIIKLSYSSTNYYKHLTEKDQRTLMEMVAKYCKNAKTEEEAYIVENILSNNMTNNDIILEQGNIDKIVSTVIEESHNQEQGFNFNETLDLSHIINELIGTKVLDKGYSKEFINSKTYIDKVINIIKKCYSIKEHRMEKLETLSQIISDNDNLTSGRLLNIFSRITSASSLEEIKILQGLANNYDSVSEGFFECVKYIEIYHKIDELNKHFTNPNILVPETSLSEEDSKDYVTIGKVMEYIGDFINNHSFEEIIRLFEIYPELKELDFSTRSGIIYISYMIKNIGNNFRKQEEKNNTLKKERNIEEGK